MKRVLIVFSAILCLALCLGLAGCSDDDGGTAAACTNDDATVANYSEDCTENSQCECNLCFPFGNGDSRCTKLCDSDDDCEAPSPGCSMNRGVCKREGAN